MCIIYFSQLLFCRINELADIIHQRLLCPLFGQVSGACGRGQFSLVAVLACFIARLEGRSVSQSLRWKERHRYHCTEAYIRLWRIH